MGGSHPDLQANWLAPARCDGVEQIVLWAKLFDVGGGDERADTPIYSFGRAAKQTRGSCDRGEFSQPIMIADELGTRFAPREKHRLRQQFAADAPREQREQIRWPGPLQRRNASRGVVDDGPALGQPQFRDECTTPESSTK
jgi:hypothetical protein